MLARFHEEGRSPGLYYAVAACHQGVVHEHCGASCEGPIAQVSSGLGMHDADATDHDAVRALRGVAPRVVAGHRDVPSVELAQEVLGRGGEELSAVVGPVALDARLAIDLGQVFGVVGEELLQASRHLIGRVVLKEVQVERARGVVEEGAPSDVAVRLGRGQRARVGPDEVAEGFRLGLCRWVRGHAARGTAWGSLHAPTDAMDAVVAWHGAKPRYVLVRGRDAVRGEMTAPAVDQLGSDLSGGEGESLGR